MTQLNQFKINFVQIAELVFKIKQCNINFLQTMMLKRKYIKHLLLDRLRNTRKVIFIKACMLDWHNFILIYYIKF